MPQPNLLGSMNVGGIELPAWQPPDIAGALVKREETRLGTEKTKLEMEKTAQDIALGGQQFYLNQLKMLAEQMGINSKYIDEYQEKIDYAHDLMLRVSDEEMYRAAESVFKTRYPEDRELWDRIFPGGYDPDQIENIASVLQDEKDRLMQVPGTARVFDPRTGKTILEPVPEPEEGDTLGEGQVRFEGAKEIARGPTAGPSLSQGVKDILAGKGLTEGTASPLDIEMARSQEQREGVEKARQTGAAGVQAQIEAREDEPVPTSELVNIVDPETFNRYPVGTTRAEVRAAGGIVTTPDSLRMLNDLDETKSLLEQMGRMANQIMWAEIPTEAAAQKAQLTWASWVKSDPRVAAYADKKQAFVGVLSRRLGGEKGVLTDRDIKRVDKAAPGFWDTRAIVGIKMLSFELLLAVTEHGTKEAIRGKRPDHKFQMAKEAALVAMETGVQEDLDFARNLLSQLEGGISTGRPAIQEGTEIENDAGEVLRWQGGQWQPIQ